MEGIIISIAFFGTVIAVIYLIFKHLNDERKRRYALIEKVLETGQQIPETENLLAEPKKNEKRSFAYFKNGILFTSCAAALWVVYLLTSYHTEGRNATEVLFPLMFIGAFFTAFGLAWLLIGWLRLIQEKNEQSLQK